MEKPFFKLAIYPIKRKRWNPMRFLFGEMYLSNNVQKWVNQLDIDAKNIKFVNKDLDTPNI